MKSKPFIELLTATILLGTGSFAYAADESGQAQENVKYKDNGGYSASSSSSETTEAGTDKSYKSSVDVNVDSNGKLTKKVKS